MVRKRKLGVQLYTLREEAAKFGMQYILKAVADMGYMVVQPAGFFDYAGRPKEFRALLDDMGLELAPCGVSLKLQEPGTAIETAHALGIRQVIAGFYNADCFKDLDAIKRTADEVNAQIDMLAPEGLELVLHNHNWEFGMVDGRLAYDWFTELCPRIKLELDAYWSQNYGMHDAAEMMRRFYDRIVLIHMKDGTGKQEGMHMRPLGEGCLNIREILEAAPETIDNVIVELDMSPINQLLALEKSYNWMVSAGLGIGYR